MWQCVLTGVKDFQFKGSDEFRLIVYVDDGSLTSEVLIHNQVVQSMVGFSAKEVSNALASSNQQELRDMKNVMMEFQTFLKKFEVFPICLYLAFLSSVHQHRGLHGNFFSNWT
jgi:RecQ-mediated genome instability protein 1